MAMIAQGLKIVQIKRCSALVDGDDVVHHLGRDEHAFPHALLAERILLELERSKRSPLPTLVEVGVVVLESGEGFLLREPGPLCMFLDAGHDLSRFLHMGSAHPVSELHTFHLDESIMRESLVQGFVVHIVVFEIRGEVGMAIALHVLQESIDVLLIPENVFSVMDVPDVPAVSQSEYNSFRKVVHKTFVIRQLSNHDSLFSEAFPCELDGLAEVSQTVERALTVAGEDLFLGQVGGDEHGTVVSLGRIDDQVESLALLSVVVHLHLHSKLIDDGEGASLEIIQPCFWPLAIGKVGLLRGGFSHVLGVHGTQIFPFHPEEHRNHPRCDDRLASAAAAHEKKALAFGIHHPRLDMVVFLQQLEVFDGLVDFFENGLQKLSGFAYGLAPRERNWLADKDGSLFLEFLDNGLN